MSGATVGGNGRKMGVVVFVSPNFFGGSAGMPSLFT